MMKEMRGMIPPLHWEHLALTEVLYKTHPGYCII
jgi:hypothetical protein